MKRPVSQRKQGQLLLTRGECGGLVAAVAGGLVSAKRKQPTVVAILAEVEGNIV